MGAWGVGPFDNDEAADWAAEFQDADAGAGLALLADALDVDDEDYLEAPDGEVAVAAAQVVAWLLDPDADESPYSEEVAGWIQRAGARPDRSLVAAARAALRRVTSDDSELAELWGETDDEDQWLAVVRRLDDALSSGA